MILAPRGNNHESISKFSAVLISEIDAPIGTKPLLWRLLTNKPIENFENAKTIIAYYEKR